MNDDMSLRLIVDAEVGSRFKQVLGDIEKEMQRVANIDLTGNEKDAIRSAQLYLGKLKELQVVGKSIYLDNQRSRLADKLGRDVAVTEVQGLLKQETALGREREKWGQQNLRLQSQAFQQAENGYQQLHRLIDASGAKEEARIKRLASSAVQSYTAGYQPAVGNIGMGNLFDPSKASASVGAMDSLTTSSNKAADAVQRIGYSGKFSVRVLEAFVLYRGFVFLEQGALNTVKALIDLDHQVSLIMTQMPNFGEGMRGVISDEIVHTAQMTGQSFHDVADALYQVTSAGYSGGQAFSILEASAKAAVAGGTSVTSAFNSALAQMNAFGIGMSHLNEVYDKQFNLVKRGIFNYEQFTTISGITAEAMAQAGQSLETNNAALAAISEVFTGPQLQRGATGLRNFALAVADTPEKFDKLGVATRMANGDIRNIINIVEDFKSKLDALPGGDRALAIKSILPDKREQAGLEALMQNMGDLKRNYIEQNLALGDMDTAFKLVSADAQTSAQRLQNSVQIAFKPLATVAGAGAKSLVAIENVLPGLTGSVIVATTAVTGLALAWAYLGKQVEDSQGGTISRGGKFISNLTTPLLNPLVGPMPGVYGGVGLAANMQTGVAGFDEMQAAQLATVQGAYSPFRTRMSNLFSRNNFSRASSPLAIGSYIAAAGIGTGIGGSETSGPGVGGFLASAGAGAGMGFMSGAGPIGAGIGFAAGTVTYLFSSLEASSKEKARLAARTFTDAFAEEIGKSGGDAAKAHERALMGGASESGLTAQDLITGNFKGKLTSDQGIWSGAGIGTGRMSSHMTTTGLAGYSEASADDLAMQKKIIAAAGGTSNESKNYGLAGIGSHEQLSYANVDPKALVKAAVKEAYAQADSAKKLGDSDTLAFSTTIHTAMQLFGDEGGKLAHELDGLYVSVTKGKTTQEDANRLLDVLVTQGVPAFENALNLLGEDVAGFAVGVKSESQDFMGSLKGDWKGAARLFENVEKSGSKLADAFDSIADSAAKYESIHNILGASWQEKVAAKPGTEMPNPLGGLFGGKSTVTVGGSPETTVSHTLGEQVLGKDWEKQLAEYAFNLISPQLAATKGQHLTAADLFGGEDEMAKKALKGPTMTASSTSIDKELDIAAEGMRIGFHDKNTGLPRLLDSFGYTADQLDGMSKQFDEFNHTIGTIHILEEFKRLGEAGHVAGYSAKTFDDAISKLTAGIKIGGDSFADFWQNPDRLAKLLSEIQFGDVNVDQSQHMDFVVHLSGGTDLNTENAARFADTVSGLIRDQLRAGK